MTYETLGIQLQRLNIIGIDPQGQGTSPPLLPTSPNLQIPNPKFVGLTLARPKTLALTLGNFLNLTLTPTTLVLPISTFLPKL